MDPLELLEEIKKRREVWKTKVEEVICRRIAGIYLRKLV